jgi:protein arginine N-methyltransferase 1
MEGGYSIVAYGDMIADGARVDAYVQALRQCVRPGCVVLDLGTGTGIFALLAARFGARRVYAIEADDAIHLARELAVRNGCSDRIEFMQGFSTCINLPEQVDVLVSDLRGVLPLFQHHLPAVIDARKRFLAPGGVLIPQQDTLWAAVVDASEHYTSLTAAWDSNRQGLDLTAGRRFVTNCWSHIRLTAEQLRTEPRCLATLDYARVESPDVAAEVAWTIARGGTAHGLGVWFDTLLAPGVPLSNAATAPRLLYGQAFFPWPRPVSLQPGDVVTVFLQANLVGNDYVWRWDTCIHPKGPSPQATARFQQSSLLGIPLSPAGLRKRAATHVPLLDEEGQIDQFILGLMDGTHTLAEMASRVMSQFPDHFSTLQNALTHVGELSQKYSRG